MWNKIEVPNNSDIWSVLVNSSVRELSLGGNAIEGHIIVDFADAIRQR
jgi:hypothetical protein